MPDTSTPKASQSPSTKPDRYDVFISHAGEDKEKVARPLARQLESLGFRVWLDENEVNVGDSLREVIDNGVSLSSFGVIILSQSFFKKRWPRYELDGLLAKDGGGTKGILPVWHQVTQNEVASFSPGLAGLVAVSTDLGIGEVANRISRAILREQVSIRSEPLPFARRRAAGLRWLSIAAALTLFAAPGLYLIQHAPAYTLANVAVENLR